MSLRQALAGQPCPRFGDGEADEGEAVTPVTGKRNARPAYNEAVTPSVTHEAKLAGRVARLEGEVAALRSQVAMLIAAMAEPAPATTHPAKPSGNAARQAAYRERRKAKVGG